MKIEKVPIDSIQEDPRNARTHPAKNLKAIRGSLERFGQAEPLVVQASTGKVIGGNGRLAVMRELGWKTVEIVRVDIDSKGATALGLALNRTAETAEWDDDQLAALLRGLDDQPLLDDIGWGEKELVSFLASVGGGGNQSRPTLADRFLVPPFSVLDARQGYWQERKQQWLALGIHSEIGREDMPGGRATAAGKNSAMNKLSGRLARDRHDMSPVVSIFDPVLCEIAYRWFSGPGAQVVDPFAGGSVRGIVAHALGRRYWGCDLSGRQVAANKAQAAAITPGNEPLWVVGDAAEALDKAPAADLVFSCPPYGDLEIYSDDPRDVSTMELIQFTAAYQEIIAKATGKLKPNRFACFVVGDYRDSGGFYRNFVSLTIRAFEEVGARLYNDAVLVTAVGSLPIRAGKPFESSRKLGKTHQNVLIFVKGDPKKATKSAGPVEVSTGDPGEQA
jgi:hypothetical protein